MLGVSRYRNKDRLSSSRHGEGRVRELRRADITEKGGQDTQGATGQSTHRSPTGQSSSAASVPPGPREDTGEWAGRRI